MKAIIDFFGKTVYTLCMVTKQPIFGLLFYIVIVFVLLLKLIMDSDNSILIGKYLMPEANKISKESKNSAESTTKIIKLAAQYNYVIFGGTLLSISETLFGILFSLGCLSDTVKELNPKLFSLELCVSPKDLLLSHQPSYAIILFTIVFAAALQYIHDNIAQNSYLIDMEKSDIIILLAMIVIAAFMPSMFGLYWFIFEAIEMFIMVFTIKSNADAKTKKLVGKAANKKR